MLSLDEQALRQVEQMREDAHRDLELADEIEARISAGEQDYITMGDEVVGFAFPKEKEDE